MIQGFPVTSLVEQNTKVLTMSLSDDKYKKIDEYKSCMTGITINMNETWNKISHAREQILGKRICLLFLLFFKN